MGTVTVLEYDAPDVGIGGLELLPMKLELDPKAEILTVGMISNLPGAEDPALGLHVEGALPARHNVAMSIHPSLLYPSLLVGLRTDEVPDRYNSSGEADPNGDYRVTLNELQFLGGEANLRRGAPFLTRFRIWYLPADGLC